MRNLRQRIRSAAPGARRRPEVSIDAANPRLQRTHAPRLPTPEHRGRRPDEHSRARTSPRGPNEGLLRRSFPDNLPQKRLKAPAADDPHRIISNQDLNSHKINAGGDLLSHTLPGAVPSAQAGLASGFGKGPGVTPPLKPPTNLNRTNHTHPTNPTGATGVPCRSRHCTMNANT